MPIFNNILVGSSGQATGYDIDQSLRFEDGGPAYMDRTPSSAGNRKTWTWSSWVKRGNLGSIQNVFAFGAASADQVTLAIHTDKISFTVIHGNTTTVEYVTTQVLRDPSAWYHIVVSGDTTPASPLFKVYLNGEQVTAFGTSTNSAAQDGEYAANNTVVHRIGERAFSSSLPFDGYLAEVHWIDGQALTPASFAESNSATNQWLPLEYTGSYGTNGFYQSYSATELANSFTDSSSSSHTITANGDVANSRAQEKIGTSSIKFDGTGDYLSVADSTDWNIFGSGDWTTETWVKLDNHSQAEHLFGQYEDSSNKWEISHNGAGSNNGLEFGLKSGGSWVISSGYASGGSGEITDTNWHHVALVKNSNTYTLYLDGTALSNTITDTDTDDISGPLSIGQNGASGSYLTGYMDEIRISNSARYTGAFTPSTTAFVADSNTKLLIHSDFDGGLGADSSGNENDFSATNLVATDQVLDSPTNNYCTLSPLWVPPQAPSARGKLSEGNLSVSSPDTSSSGYNGATLGTIGVASGKWYFEYYAASANYPAIGIAKTDYNQNFATTNVGNRVWLDGGDLYGTGSSASGTTWTTGDIVGCAVDMDNGKMWFSKNGTFISSGDPAAGSNAQFSDLLSGSDMSSFVTPFWSDVNWGTTDSGVLNFGQDSSFAGAKTSGAAGSDFYYTPPTGYKALNSSNLDDPAIALPTDHFDTTLYTGTGATKSISSLAFAPDFTWIKSRDNSYLHNLQDSVRGAGESLFSNNTDAETTDADSITSFDSDGWTMGADDSSWTVNKSGPTYAGWAWKGGGTASSNSDGSITSSVSANTTAGFSIVSWTGNLTSNTIGHGLSQAPELIIVKDRAGVRGWPTNTTNITGTANQYLLLNDPDSVATSAAYWGAAPGASTFTVGDSGNTNSASAMIAYCFHSVPGFSKVGSYEGNNDADGAFIYTGFKPAMVIIKELDASRSWVMFDNKRNPYNEVTTDLKPDSDSSEGTSRNLDFLSNGIKMRESSAYINDALTYIYIAFAESPFKTSNAR